MPALWPALLACAASLAGIDTSPVLRQPSPPALPALAARLDAPTQIAWRLWGRTDRRRRAGPAAVVWPGGASADLASVKGWAQVRLAGPGASCEGGQGLTAPRLDAPPRPDGLWRGSEWPQPIAVQTAAGPVLIAAAWHAQVVYFAVAIPAVPNMAVGTSATLALSPAVGGTGLPKSAIAVRVSRPERLKPPVVRVGRPWRGGFRFGSAQRAKVAGWLDELGDGAWRFVVAEFAVAASELGLQAREGASVLAAAVVRGLPASTGAWDGICWPLGNCSGCPREELFLCEHPDAWGEVALQGQEDGLAAGELKRAPQVDGAIDEAEWAGAGCAEKSFLGTGLLRLYLGRAAGKLFGALQVQTPRQEIRHPELEVYIDPAGDGGLLPRPDDRLWVWDGKAARCYRWQMPAGAKAKVVTRKGCWRGEIPTNAQFAWKVKANQLSCEFALPIEELQVSEEASALRMLVRLRYLAPFKLHARQARGG